MWKLKLRGPRLAISSSVLPLSAQVVCVSLVEQTRVERALREKDGRRDERKREEGGGRREEGVGMVGWRDGEVWR